MAITSNSGSDSATTAAGDNGVDAPAGTTPETVTDAAPEPQKKESKMANSKSDIQKRKIAKYKGSTIHTRILDKKSVNKTLKTAIDRDLVFEASNNWEQDVTDAPQEVLDYLEKTDPDFTVSERDVDMSDADSE